MYFAAESRSQELVARDQPTQDSIELLDRFEVQFDG
jgi:hypothetical protein